MSYMRSPWFSGDEFWIVFQGWGSTSNPMEPAPNAQEWAQWPGHPLDGQAGSRWHAGVDVGPAYGSGSCGALVTAGRLCTVISVGGPETYYGPSYVALDLLDGTMAILGHGDALCRPGQTLNPGASVMAVNTLGASSGCHLHFEVRPLGGGYGSDVDPTPYLQPPPTPVKPFTEDDDMYVTLAVGATWIGAVAPNTNFNFAAAAGSSVHVDAYHPNGDPIGGKDYTVPGNLASPGKGPVQAYDSAAGIGVGSDGGTLVARNSGPGEVSMWLHREG